MKERIAKSFFWIVWSEATVRLISFLSALIIMRFLTPKEYGLMALAAVWTNVITLVSDAGLGSAVVRFRGLGSRELNSCFWLNLAIAGLGYGALYATAPFIAGWFRSPPLTDLLRIIGLCLPLIAVRIVPAGLLRKRLQFNKICKAEIISLLVSTPLVIAMAWGGAGVWSLAIGLLVATLVETSMNFWFVPWRPGLQFGGEKLGQILHFSWATLGSRVFWSLYHQSDRVILGKIAGEASLGSYAVARQLASLPVGKVRGVVTRLAVPVMAELQDDLAALRNSLLRSVRLVTWVVAPVCVGMMLTVEDFVRVALPAQWSGIVPIVQLLCIHSLMQSITGLFPPVLTARYRADFMFFFNLTLLAVMPPIFWAAATWSGAVGVAAVWAFIYPLFHLYMALEAFKEVELSRKAIWKQIRPPLIAVAIMVLAVLGIRSLLPSSYPPILGLATSVLTGAGAYAAAFLWIGGRSRGEIWEAAGWLLYRGSKLAEGKQA
jgi:O-antigen/teichoic acid export membrane protein